MDRHPLSLRVPASRRISRRTCQLTRAASAIAMLLAASGAHAAVGARIGIQLWDPSRPHEERVVVPYDHATVVSDAVVSAWAQVRPSLCQLLRQELGIGNRFGRGVTLYNIDCRLQAAPQFAVRQTGANQLEFSLALPGNTIIASATTPSMLGKSFDPRVSVDFRLDLVVSVALQQDPRRTVEVTGVRAALSGARLDSQNLAADLMKAMNSVFAYVGGLDFKRLAETSLNSLSGGGSMKATANALLAPVNAALTPPATHVRAGAWFHNQKIVLALAPRNLPAPSQDGAVEGAIRWPAALAAENGCASFSMASRVQVGPRPITGPTLTLGAPPMRDFGSFVPLGQPVRKADRLECRYRLSGLPAFYANRLMPGVPKLVVPGQRPVSTSSTQAPVRLAMLRPEGWSGAPVVPAAEGTGRDFAAVVQAIDLGIPVAVRPQIPLVPAATPVMPRDPLVPVPPRGPVVQPLPKAPMQLAAPAPRIDQRVALPVLRLPVAPRTIQGVVR